MPYFYALSLGQKSSWWSNAAMDSRFYSFPLC